MIEIENSHPFFLLCIVVDIGIAPIGSYVCHTDEELLGNFGRYSIVRVVVALLEQVCH